MTTKLNRTHVTGGREVMIWPCLGRTEIDGQASGPQFVTVEDSMSVVHVSQGPNKPASPQLQKRGRHRLPGWRRRRCGAAGWIGTRCAADYDRIRDRIERVVPGFEAYNRRVREPGGFVLRNAAAHREWNTQTGRANFVVVPTPDIQLGRESCGCSPSARTTSTTPPSTAWTTATAASSRRAAWC